MVFAKVDESFQFEIENEIGVEFEYLEKDEDKFKGAYEDEIIEKMDRVEVLYEVVDAFRNEVGVAFKYAGIVNDKFEDRYEVANAEEEDVEFKYGYGAWIADEDEVEFEVEVEDDVRFGADDDVEFEIEDVELDTKGDVELETEEDVELESEDVQFKYGYGARTAVDDEVEFETEGEDGVEIDVEFVETDVDEDEFLETAVDNDADEIEVGFQYADEDEVVDGDKTLSDMAASNDAIETGDKADNEDEDGGYNLIDALLESADVDMDDNGDEDTDEDTDMTWFPDAAATVALGLALQTSPLSLKSAWTCSFRSGVFKVSAAPQPMSKIVAKRPMLFCAKRSKAKLMPPFPVMLGTTSRSHPEIPLLVWPLRSSVAVASFERLAVKPQLKSALPLKLLMPPPS